MASKSLQAILRTPRAPKKRSSNLAEKSENSINSINVVIEVQFVAVVISSEEFANALEFEIGKIC